MEKLQSISRMTKGREMVVELVEEAHYTGNQHYHDPDYAIKMKKQNCCLSCCFIFFMVLIVAALIFFIIETIVEIWSCNRQAMSDILINFKQVK